MLIYESHQFLSAGQRPAESGQNDGGATSISQPERSRVGEKARNGESRKGGWSTLYYTPFVSYGVPQES